MRKNLLTALACAALILFGARAVSADEFGSDGVKIHYTVSGKGDPVILIHGLYSSAKMNWDLPGISGELAQHFQVIELDNRGHGQSGKPKEEGRYGTNMVGDIVRLMDHLHIAKVRVVGYSMGGMITLKLLTMHPERVSSAVLGGWGWLKQASPLQRVWEAIGGGQIGSVPPACLHGLAQLAVTESEVKAVHVPVTIIVGSHDPCRRLYVEPLSAIRPDWPVHVIGGAGHLTCVTMTDFKAQLLSALESN